LTPKRKDDDRDPKAASRAYLARFGERVRALREKQGITLKQLAQLSGLSDRYIIQVEQGAANPSLESVLRLALALQTSVTGLLPEDAKNATASGPARKILQLLEGRSSDQITRIADAVSAFLEPGKGRHIALVGMRGAGKTTLGQLLSRRMTVPFYELDQLIENDTGLSLAEIFDLEGEEYYRAVEEKTLAKVLKRKSGIIAAGGGLVMNPTALFLLKLNASIVWLQAAPEALLARVRSSKDQTRLGAYPQASKQLKAILDRRTPYYAQADLVIDTTHKSPEAIVDTIVHAFTDPSVAGRQRTPPPLAGRYKSR
jgi:XRE family transcriptional regulator, aerobic/anaerobic benzoate catabolism transcriptional regulator